jgi:hypothetical protein
LKPTIAIKQSHSLSWSGAIDVIVPETVSSCANTKSVPKHWVGLANDGAKVDFYMFIRCPRSLR